MQARFRGFFFYLKIYLNYCGDIQKTIYLYGSILLETSKYAS